MVITRKDIETKEIEIPGFRKILKNSKDPDYKELRIYIKNGWIPVDPEDDEREIKKAKRRKQIAKKNKERRPKYEEMKKAIENLNDIEMLNEFNKKREIKYNYNNVLNWYNDKMKEKNGQNGADKTPGETKQEAKKGK